MAKQRLAIALLAIFTVWITWRAKVLEGGLRTETGVALFNQTAPDFSLKTLDGNPVTLAGFHNRKNVVVTFWASWCAPCRLELPLLREFYERARKERDDFEILAISTDEYKDSAQAAAASMRLPFPVLFDEDQKVVKAYTIYSIPTLMVIDKSGKVIEGRTGFDASLQYLLAHDLGVDPNLFLPKMPNANVSPRH